MLFDKAKRVHIFFRFKNLQNILKHFLKTFRRIRHFLLGLLIEMALYSKKEKNQYIFFQIMWELKIV